MKKSILMLTVSFALFLAACGSDSSPEQKMVSLQVQAVKWRTLQHNYAVPNAKVGSDQEIGYVFGASDDSRVADATAYFKQETKIDGKIATWTISAKKSIGDCKNGTWTIIYNADNPTNPSRAVVSGENCESLYPDFCRLANSGKCGMEEILPPPEPANSPDAVKSELESAAKKWMKDGKAAPNTKLFTFSAKGGEGGFVWKATSKEKIGDCPTRSVWEMGREGCERWNNVPAKCKSITPTTITAYEGDDPGC